ncbi:MAG: YceI family protein [Bacteroidia bacterium]
MSNTKWSLDPTHSEVQFKVKHLMIANVSGDFKKFDASVETTDEDFSTAKINFSADINSINTNNEQRDGHLKTGDFFEAEKFPQIKFESTKLEKVDAENFKLHGNFTMKGVTKAEVLDVEFGGIVPKDPWGHTRAGFTISGKVNRQDYGVGSVGVSDEVKLYSNMQFVKQA